MDMLKSKEQRKAEINALLEGIDNKVIDATLPKDIIEIGNILDGAEVVDFLKGIGVFNKADINEVATKKGAKIYQIYSTGGFALKDIGKVKGHTLAVKVALFLR